MSLDLERNRMHVAVCLATLKREGMPDNVRADVWVLDIDNWCGDRPRKMFLWFTESLLYAFRELGRGERCDWRVVLRVYGQACGYKGELEGMACMGARNSMPSSTLYDALRELQNVIEERVTR